MTKPELFTDEYVDWFRDVTGRVLSLATMCRTIIRLGFTYKKVRESRLGGSLCQRLTCTLFQLIADIQLPFLTVLEFICAFLILPLLHPFSKVSIWIC